MEYDQRLMVRPMDGKPINIKPGLLKIKLRSSEKCNISGNNKECIGSTDDEEELDLEQKQQQVIREKEEEDRVCKVCSKTFSSGRALGGHMRVHYISQISRHQQQQQQHHHHQTDNLAVEEVVHVRNKDKDKGYPDPNSNSTRSSRGGNYEMEGYNSNVNTTCCLCGRTFPSRKSLFGHMRCHPERPWRGVQPPLSTAAAPSCLININYSSTATTTTAAASSTVSSSDSRGGAHKIMDDWIYSAQAPTLTPKRWSSSSDPPRGWAVTAKRGRKSTTSASVGVNNKVDAVVDDSDEQQQQQQQQQEGMMIPEGAYHLMMLASCTTHSSERSHQQQQQQQQLDSSTKNPRMSYYNDDKSSGAGAGDQWHDDQHFDNGGSGSDEEDYQEEELQVEESAAGHDGRSSSTNRYSKEYKA